jgi:hypothetical protein
VHVRRYWLVLTLGGAAVFGCCYQAPWVQGSGAFQSDGSLGFAPIWTRDFRYFPGARVDLSALATHLVFALGMAALIGLGQAIRRPQAVEPSGSPQGEPGMVAGPDARKADDVLSEEI